MTQHKRMAILVGGGPAPGINSVISSATIRGELLGVEVLGIYDGFKWLMEASIDHLEPLTIEKVSRIHFRGGSIIRTSRANPTRDPRHLENIINSLLRLGVSQLITIGGDDTAFSALNLADKSPGRLAVVHVPKTIDNDLALPAHVDTFGYQTARHCGVEVVKNIMVDARTTSRWYFIIAMGRKAGHLALGIGKAVGSTLTLIPEEFGPAPVKLETLVDTLVGSIIKRLSYGRPDGVAVIAEGVVLGIDPDDLNSLEGVERDAHGHLRIADVDIGQILKQKVQARLAELSIETTVVAKNIGYELRCADPIPYDMEYTRDLGYCAAQYLFNGHSNAMITMQGGKFVPVPFQDILDPETGRTRVRLVDTQSTSYAIAHRYMIRLKPEDFENADDLERFAATCGLSVPAFRERFEYLVHLQPQELKVVP